MEQLYERIFQLAENNLNILIPLYVLNVLLSRLFDFICLYGVFWLLKRVYLAWADWMKKENKWPY